MTGTCTKRPCARAQCIPMEHCTCQCGGWGHNPAVELVRRHVERRKAKRTARKVSRREQAGRDQDREQKYRSLHPAEIMGGGLVAPRPRRAKDAGGDDYTVALQAWLDDLEAAGHVDDVPHERRGRFWNSARTGRGWKAQENSAFRRTTGSRILDDWVRQNPRPRRADFRGELAEGDEKRRDENRLSVDALRKLLDW